MSNRNDFIPTYVRKCVVELLSMMSAYAVVSYWVLGIRPQMSYDWG